MCFSFIQRYHRIKNTLSPEELARRNQRAKERLVVIVATKNYSDLILVFTLTLCTVQLVVLLSALS